MPKAKKSNDPQIFEIKMPKRFTFENNQKFHDLLKDIAGDKCQAIILDMQDTEFMDSAGLGLLLLAREQAAKSGVVIELKNLQGYVIKLFQITRFHELFKVTN